MKKTALILIDIQNIYFTEGTYLLHEPEKAAAVASKVLEDFRQKNLPVIHVKHNFGGKVIGKIAKGINAINDAVLPLSNEKIVNKNHPNSFLKTDLLPTLQAEKVTDVVIAGMMSHMCVDTTVRACQDYGYSVTVIQDACTTKDLKWRGEIIDAVTVHKSFMAALDGMFAKVVDYEEWK